MSDQRDHRKAETLLISAVLKGSKAHEASVGFKVPFCLGTDPNTLQAGLVHGWDISQIVHQRTFAPSQTLLNSSPYRAVLFRLLYFSDYKKWMAQNSTNKFLLEKQKFQWSWEECQSSHSLCREHIKDLVLIVNVKNELVKQCKDEYIS